MHFTTESNKTTDLKKLKIKTESSIIQVSRNKLKSCSNSSLPHSAISSSLPLASSHFSSSSSSPLKIRFIAKSGDRECAQITIKRACACLRAQRALDIRVCEMLSVGYYQGFTFKRVTFSYTKVHNFSTIATKKADRVKRNKTGRPTSISSPSLSASPFLGLSKTPSRLN